MATIKVVKATKIYGKQTALLRASLDVNEGQIYGLIGPSGAGKTTLVKAIVGMIEVDEGSVEVLQRKMPNLSVLQEIGYIAQADSLYDGLTGEENLQFFASLFGLNKKEQKERIAYTAGLVNLTPDLKKKVFAYSGGMKRRLSLAIALIQSPKLLILDEPTVGIDPELRRTIWLEFNRLQKEEGKTIVVTTHIMDEAAKCDVLAMIRDGKIIAKGSPEELKKEYHASDLEEVFLLAAKEKK